MKTIIIGLILFAFSFSQSFDFSKNYQFKSAKDYDTYQREFLSALKYLEQNSFNINDSKRKKVNAFVLKWITGTPTLSLKIESYMMNFSKKNSDFIIIFLGNMAKYKIENPSDDSNINSQLEGIRSVLNVYNKQNGIKDDAFIEKVIEIEKNGKLGTWLKTQLKSKV